MEKSVRKAEMLHLGEVEPYHIYNNFDNHPARRSRRFTMRATQQFILLRSTIMEGLKGYLLKIVMGLQDENKEVTGNFYVANSYLHA